MSTFFTLSGFLITSLLLREWNSSDEGVDLRRFWRRRFRRLLPASWMTIGAVLLMALVGIWNTDQLRSLRGDVPFALAEIINWHFIAQDRSYGADFLAPSPLEHFWSLAVEQQFYVILPLLVVYLFSLDFLDRGIDSWFRVEIRQGLNDALVLSRAALDLRIREHGERTERFAQRLGAMSDLEAIGTLDDERRASGAVGLVLFGEHDRTVAASLALIHI